MNIRHPTSNIQWQRPDQLAAFDVMFAVLRSVVRSVPLFLPNRALAAAPR
jgi:hypothetical protein